MNQADRARRLVRANALVQKLRKFELIELQRLAEEAGRMRVDASELDALTEARTSALALFPVCWMAHRAKLETRMSDLRREIEARSKSAHKLKIMSQRLDKKAEEEIAAFELRKSSEVVAEYIAKNSGKPGKGSGKLDDSMVKNLL